MPSNVCQCTLTHTHTHLPSPSIDRSLPKAIRQSIDGRQFVLYPTKAIWFGMMMMTMTPMKNGDHTTITHQWNSKGSHCCCQLKIVLTLNTIEPSSCSRLVIGSHFIRFPARLINLSTRLCVHSYKNIMFEYYKWMMINVLSWNIII